MVNGTSSIPPVPARLHCMATLKSKHIRKSNIRKSDWFSCENINPVFNRTHYKVRLF